MSSSSRWSPRIFRSASWGPWGRRITEGAIFLLAITFISFGVVKLAPGDVTLSILRVDTIAVTQADIERVRDELGLNDHVIVQYWHYIQNVARFDFGESMMTGLPVAEELAKAFPYTILLAGAAIAITLVVTVTLGGMSARHPGGWADRFTTMVCLTGASIPTFWLGLVLLDVFAVRLKWLPAMGLYEPGGLILPAVSLAVGMMPPYIKLFRNSLIDSASLEFVRAARSRGLPERTVFGRHVVRASVIPIITILGVSLGSLLGGTVIIEVVFGIPGVGKLAAEALVRRDYAVIQAFILWIGIAVFVINLVVDLSYRVLDPSIALRQRGRK